MKKWETKYLNLCNASRRLSEAVAAYDGESDIIRDAVIQRFEFTFELTWKTMRDFLQEQGVRDMRFSREVLKKAYAYDIIENDDPWLNMLDDRNDSSHNYEESMADAICRRAVSSYHREIAEVVARLGDLMREAGMLPEE